MASTLVIDHSSATEQLRRLSLFLGGDFIEEYGSAKCILDNEKGKGYINSYDLFPGLAIRTYNVTFFEEVRFSKDKSSQNPLYFLYALEGHYFHQFDNEDEPLRIEQKQNVILKSGVSSGNMIIFPAGLRLKLSVIFLTKRELDDNLSADRPMESSLLDIFDFVNDKEPYRYLGKIDLDTASHATILIENERTDIIGKMKIEAAVMNTIVQQVQNFERHSEMGSVTTPLSKTEITQISGIADYVNNHIAKPITLPVVSSELGISSKKIQYGIKYLFGQTYSQFVTTLRLENAKVLLQTTDYNISEITYRIGISSRSYFSKIFMKQFGVKPSAYRNYLSSSNCLFELSYRSLTMPNLPESDIQKIVKEARAFNGKNKITGCLIYHEDAFFQLLEGPKTAVLNLFHKIKRDRRHTDVELLWKGPKATKIFEEWDMALLSPYGTVKIPLQGSPIAIDFEQLSRELKQPSIDSSILWRRVRNMLKTA